MLYQMKTLNIKKLRTEFLMLTEFHATNFEAQVALLPLDQTAKDRMRQEAALFMEKLFELSEHDPKATNDSSFARQAREAHAQTSKI